MAIHNHSLRRLHQLHSSIRTKIVEALDAFNFKSCEFASVCILLVSDAFKTLIYLRGPAVLTTVKASRYTQFFFRQIDRLLFHLICSQEALKLSNQLLTNETLFHPSILIEQAILDSTFSSQKYCLFQ